MDNEENSMMIFDDDCVETLIGMLFRMEDSLKSVRKLINAVERAKNDRSGGGEIMVEFTKEEFEEFGKVLSFFPFVETEELKMRISKDFQGLEAWEIKQ